MKTHTYQQIADDWTLWCDYADPEASMTRAEFDALDVEQRIKILIDAFGKQILIIDEANESQLYAKHI
jgi:hypothetical protein